MTGRGPILDRPLEPAWLDAALRIARDNRDLDEVRSQLRVTLGDSGLGTAARVKTLTVLVRMWAQPSEASSAAICWARDALADEEDLRAVHFGALLAAYPFFGDVCATVGRVLALEEQVTTPDVRARMRASWGDRRTVHNAVQRSIKTLRAFELLTGEPGSSISRRAERVYVSPRAGRWIAHTLLLSRSQESIAERDLRSAPELFGLRLPERLDNGYRLLERHREGGGRTVLAVV
ncbi:MAG: hypothetical protein WKF96_07565 [Solirubrobacteraceae bacterium]